MTSSSTVSAANVASGIEGTLGSVKINGYDTMRQYIDKNFTYTDSMTEADYRTERSASYDRNDSSTGKNSTDYLVQAVEWTDQKNGEALLSVAGKDTTDSRAVYIMSTCNCVFEIGLLTYRNNIRDLLHTYDRVDVVVVNGADLWYPTPDDSSWHQNNYTNWTVGGVSNPSDALGNRGSCHGGRVGIYSTSVIPSGQLNTGILPYYSFISEDYTSDAQIDTAIVNYFKSFEWRCGSHATDLFIPALYAYMMGTQDEYGNAIPLDYEHFNTAQVKGYDMTKGVLDPSLDNSNAPVQYRKALDAALNTSFDVTKAVNIPTAVYMTFSDPSHGMGSLYTGYPWEQNADFYQFLADTYCSDDWAWIVMGHFNNWTLSDSYSYERHFWYGSSYPTSFSSWQMHDFDYAYNYKDKARCIAAAINPKWTAENFDKFTNASSWTTPEACKHKFCYNFKTPFISSDGTGVILPDKRLGFDIPIGDSWQVDVKNLPKANILYTYKYPNTGKWADKSAKGDKLKATVTIDTNNVIHITTNTYVKGAEISIQIPLKYSANGVQSAKQLRVGEDGKVYTDGKSGTPVADTYIISMTAGDTKLHVGPDTLGDLDTSLSIYMPSNALMDVQVNLHWMNDSDTIKGMLGDTSVRGNATALIGSDALVGNKLGKQSDDDEKAGGIGTSVVAMNFANANGSVGTIASSYTDSDGITRQLSNGSVDLQLRTKNGAPDLWTDAKDEAGENNVVTYMMFNVPRFGHPTANTYDANGNVTSVTDLASGVVPRYYYVEDVVNVPAGYTAYNITNMASSDLEKLQKAIGTDTENPMTYNNALYYAYTVTPPSDWNSSSKVTYTIDCYVALDIKSLKMTVEHYQEQLTGDGYTPSTNKQYKLESSIDSYEAITSVYSPEVKTYAGYDSPDRQSLTVTVTGDRVIKYYYDLHYYDINVDTQGGEWYEEQDDGTWNAISEPPAHYTILTPTFTLPIPDKVGFDFEGYTGTGLSKVTHDVTIEKGTTGDKAYKANWIAQAYDVEVPVSLIFSASYDGVMKGAFDQNGSGKVAKTGFLLNNSKFPVQVTHITYNNDSVYTMSDVKSDKPNIMNWRLDATNGTHTYNAWATALDDTVDVSAEETYWMAQNSEGQVILDSDQAWYRNDVPDIKDTTKIGNIVWTFGIGHRNVVERPIVAAK